MTTTDKQQAAEYKADIVLEFIQEYGRLPKFEEKYKDVRVGGFVSAARQYRSRLAREALTKRGIDFDATRRFCKPHTQNHADLSNHSAFLPGSSSVVRNDRNAAATNNSKSL